jgi:hypothetical protein
MVENTHKKFIDIKELPVNLIPPCKEPNIVPLMTYRDPSKSIDEVLNAKCKKGFCLRFGCRFKKIVNF